MKYTNKTFHVPLATENYREGWERIFGKDKEADAEPDPDRIMLCMGCCGELAKDGFCLICGEYR